MRSTPVSRNIGVHAPRVLYLSTLVLLGFIGLCAFVFMSYCWGWWGRESLVAGAFWQCSCPRASETARIAPFRMLVSACERPSTATVSPTGEYMFVTFQHNTTNQARVIDLETGIERPTPFIANEALPIGFIDDTHVLLRLQYNAGYVLFDVVDRSQSFIPGRTQSRIDDITINELRRADRIVLFQKSYILALSDDHTAPNANNWIIDFNGAISGASSEVILQLETDNIEYQYEARNTIPKHLTATSEGILDAYTEQPIVKTGFRQDVRFPYEPIGWSPHSGGVVYLGPALYLIDDFLFGKHFRVDRPVLVTNVASWEQAF
jgi:hypothetical protein